MATQLVDLAALALGGAPGAAVAAAERPEEAVSREQLAENAVARPPRVPRERLARLAEEPAAYWAARSALRWQ
ncbi:hypothetical protein GTR02_04080 [Kineococcus sp. R8]|nr:hypothetical protein [Kineococcus siccus]NAZ80992.1 hypothetical protein [Kineococcus siccus]